jgi:hypothetical protein
LDDADCKCMEMHHGPGVRLGVGETLPRTPASFPAKVKWKRDYEEFELLGSEPINENYLSAKQRVEELKEELRGQVAADMMEEMSFEEARRRWGQSLTVASLAMIPERGSFRLIHDGSHHVRVNHRIHVRDREQHPTAGDVAAGIRSDREVTEASGKSKCKYIAMAADVSKAHRRVPVKECDWGWQACAADPPPKDGGTWRIFVNKVGTYGIGSASYWWSRLSMVFQRISIAVLTPVGLRWLFRFSDDFQAIATHWHALFDLLVLWEVLEIPLKWPKLEGGSAVPWVGFVFDHNNSTHGLSSARLEWLEKWAARTLRDRVASVREMRAVLGRLFFTTAIYRMVTPFLAPIYQWVGALPDSMVAQVPVAVLLSIAWIARAIRDKPMLPMAPRWVATGEIFRSDARADEKSVTIGGWRVVSDRAGGTMAATWFAEDVPPTMLWAYSKDGKPQRAIAALELFATLMSIKLLVPPGEEGEPCERHTILEVGGGTDNKGNSHTVDRSLCTKYPLCLVLMETMAELDGRNAVLDLRWRRRCSNEEADRLSNHEYAGFNPQLRRRINWEAPDWKVLGDMDEAARTLYRQVQELREEKKRHRTSPPASRKAAKSTSLRQADPW